MTELDKLEAYLKENEIKYKRIDEPCQWKQPTDLDLPEGFGERHQILVYDGNDKYMWDAICHWGSYGYEDGLLEVMGPVMVEQDMGVEGFLTAEDIINKIEGEIWIFTFGCGQNHAGHYVRLEGDFDTARDKMFFLFGREWSMQYSLRSWMRQAQRGSSRETKMTLTEKQKEQLDKAFG